MRSLHRFAVLRPYLALGLTGLATLLAIPGWLRLELRTDGRELAPRDAPEVELDAAVRRESGLRDPFVVLVRSSHERGIFNPETLRLIVLLTADAARLPGVEPQGVTSLATEPGDRHRPGSLDYSPLLEPLPATQLDCDRVRADLEALQLYTGTLASRDGKAAAILVGVPPGADRAALYGALAGMARERSRPPHRLDVVGAPAAEVLLGIHILGDLGVPSSFLGPGATVEEEGRGLLRRIGLVPLALAIMVSVFLVSFRRPAAALLPLLEVGGCLAFVLGVMGLTGTPVYLTITVLPVILTVAGVTDEVHLLWRYQRALREDESAAPASAVLRTFDELFLPISKTSATTIIGFLSFAVSPLPPVRAFGLVAALGILYCYLYSLLVVPAALVLLPPRLFVRRRRPGAELAGPSPLVWLGELVVRRRGVVLAITLLLVAATPWGLSRLVVQDSWTDSFAPGSAFHAATRYFNEQFLGVHRLVLQVDTGSRQHEWQAAAEEIGDHEILVPGGLDEDPARLAGRPLKVWPPAASGDGPAQGPAATPGATAWDGWIETAAADAAGLRLRLPLAAGSPRLLLRPVAGQRARCEIGARRLASAEVLHALVALSSFLAAPNGCAVGGVLGPAEHLAMTSFILSGRKPASRRIPDDRFLLESLWRNYGVVRGEARLRELVDPRLERALVTVYLTDASYVGTRQLLEALRRYESEHLAPLGIQLRFAGDVAVSQALIAGIVGTEVRSVLGSIAGIFLVTTILGRSLLWGLWCIVPCVLAVLVNFAVMGWAGIPLGVATSMFSSIVLGIGVDYAIHLLEAIREARRTTGSAAGATVRALGAAGPAMAADAAAVALGFGVLAISSLPATARLGGLLALSIATAFATTCLVLPALLGGEPPTLRDAPGDARVGACNSSTPG